MEMCCDLFDRLPVDECRRLFGDNADTVLELKKLKSKLKAKSVQTERTLKRIVRDEQEADAMLAIEAEAQYEQSWGGAAETNERQVEERIVPPQQSVRPPPRQSAAEWLMTPPVAKSSSSVVAGHSSWNMDGNRV